ncbi:uncharacterized protein LOC110020048 [Phalaenopsis equestris]|uniref:uncharacterized protein LOC110020048 n=1 Tax=Phalaenopsis equestris TaxID=78828 RepID=UPI0009E195F4|nr:uncharacterized protein LOC110020048 [Phalaenopsis equestris]
MSRRAQTCSPNSTTAAVTQNVNGFIHAPNITTPHSHRSLNPLSSFATPKQNPSPRLSLSQFGSCRFNKRNLGILAALPEEVNSYPLLHRNLSSYFSVCSSYSFAREILAISKPKLDCVLSMMGGNMYHQSAPMDILVMPLMTSKELAVLDWDVRGHADVFKEDIMPPHEIVPRVSSIKSPMISFSMLGGVGRTLKGRDLRMVRNDVWRQTGFQD